MRGATAVAMIRLDGPTTQTDRHGARPHRIDVLSAPRRPLVALPIFSPAEFLAYTRRLFVFCCAERSAASAFPTFPTKSIFAN